MRNYRYVHFVARFNNRYLSGVIDAAPEMDAVAVHEGIQLRVCRKWHLSEMHLDDVIVEEMRPIE